MRALLDNDEDIDLQSFVRGAIGFDAILPIRPENGGVDRWPGCRIYEKDFTYSPGHCQLEVEIYEYLPSHGSRPDSAHVSFRFEAAYVQPVYGSANVYDLRKARRLGPVVNLVAETIARVGQIQQEWAAEAELPLDAAQTSPLIARVKELLNAQVEQISEVGNPNMRPYRSPHNGIPQAYRDL